MTLDQFRPHVKDWFNPFVAVSMRLGLTPNAFTVASFLAAIAAGIFFYLNLIVAALVMVGLNAVFDAMDGVPSRGQ